MTKPLAEAVEHHFLHLLSLTQYYMQQQLVLSKHSPFTREMVYAK